RPCARHADAGAARRPPTRRRGAAVREPACAHLLPGRPAGHRDRNRHRCLARQQALGHRPGRLQPPLRPRLRRTHPRGRVAVTVWYHVRDLDAARAFYKEKLGFTEMFVEEGEWSKLERNGMEIGLARGEPEEDGGVAHVDVDDVKATAEELRAAG